MGLEIHEINLLPDGGRSYKLLASVRLSGVDGLVSRYISVHQDLDLGQWVIRAPDVASLVGLSTRNVALLCSTGSEYDGAREYGEVVSIAGSSRSDHTDLVLMQRPIRTIPSLDGSLAETAPARSEYSMESLAVQGGTSRTPHSWKLVTSELKIGGVIR
jgi:hypothetical protein